MKNIQLTDAEYKLLLSYFEELDDKMSCAGCNDLDKEIEESFTPEEGQKIAEEFAFYNNPEKPDGPPWPLPDFCLLTWFRNKIEKQNESLN